MEKELENNLETSAVWEEGNTVAEVKALSGEVCSHIVQSRSRQVASY